MKVNAVVQNNLQKNTFSHSFLNIIEYNHYSINESKHFFKYSTFLFYKSYTIFLTFKYLITVALNTYSTSSFCFKHI